MEARSWTQPLSPVLPPPDAFLHLRLRLGDAWLAEDGTWHAIDVEPSAGLWSILGYLRWHAPALARQDAEAQTFADPDAFLASRPLVTAIDAELASRGEIAQGDALACLRTLGAAPWELPPSVRRVRRGALGR